MNNLKHNVILYTTNCPKCKILKTKLDNKNIQYTIIDDIDEMIRNKFVSLPMLEIDNKTLDFIEANKWLKEQE